jgi:hypothetical protein
MDRRASRKAVARGRGCAALEPESVAAPYERRIIRGNRR